MALCQNVAHSPRTEPGETVVGIGDPFVGEQSHLFQRTVGNGVGGTGIIIEGFRGVVNYAGDGIVNTFQPALAVVAIGCPEIRLYNS